MAFHIDEDAISEIVGDPNSPTNVQLQNLRNWIRDVLDTGNYNGNPDFGMITRKLAQSLNNASDKICMLVLKHQLILNGLRKNLDVATKDAYEKLHTTKAKWAMTDRGDEIMVKGDSNLAELRERVANEEAFLKMLEHYQDMVRYFPRNIDILIRAHNYGTELGQVTVAIQPPANMRR